MRSIHSILDRTDQRHLKEIILVDDYSDLAGLHEKVQRAVSQLNGRMRKEEEMLETNNIDGDDENLVDYINDDNNNDKKTTEKSYLSKDGLNVRLLRTTKREGLIRARLYGADNSVGEVRAVLLRIIQILFHANIKTCVFRTTKYFLLKMFHLLLSFNMASYEVVGLGISLVCDHLINALTKKKQKKASTVVGATMD